VSVEVKSGATLGTNPRGWVPAQIASAFSATTSPGPDEIEQVACGDIRMLGVTHHNRPVLGMDLDLKALLDAEHDIEPTEATGCGSTNGQQIEQSPPGQLLAFPRPVDWLGAGDMNESTPDQVVINRFIAVLGWYSDRDRGLADHRQFGVPDFENRVVREIQPKRLERPLLDQVEYILRSHGKSSLNPVLL